MPNYTIKVTNKSGALIASPTTVPTITSQLSSQSMSGITSIQTSNGITGGPITTSGTISVLANTGLIANATGLHVNSDFISSLTFNSANSATYLGNSSGTIANIASWITSNSGTAYTNSVSYVDGKSFVNTSQLSSNLANYQTSAGLASNVATLTANNTSFVGGISAANVVSNAQLQANLANYQTSAGLSANVATLTANSAIYLGNSSGTIANVVSWITSNSSTAYTNAISFASNATNISSGILNEARLPFRMDQNIRTTDSVNFGSITVAGNLTIGGSYVTVSGNTVTFTDNMLYLNQGISANITNITSNGSYIVFTSNNNYQVGWDVQVTDVNPSSYNGLYTNIFSANATTFTVANTNIDSYVSGGIARGKSSANPDIGFAAGYNDGAYHHTGFFRDHITGVWKVFDKYDPEPDSSIYIDQSNNSFNIAPFQANNIYIGNNTVYGTINATSFTGSANSATYLGGNTASDLRTYTDQKSGNAYTNAVSYVDGKSYVNTSQLSSNLANYQTSAGLASNVATLTANNTSFVGSTSAANVVSNAQLQANLTNYALLSGANFTGSVTVTNGFIVSTTITANSSNGTSGQVLTSNGTGVYWSTISGGGGFTNGQSISVDNFTVTGSFSANSSNGTSGQVLTSNGTGVYWSTISGSSGGTVTSVDSGNGLTGGPITGSGALSVLANTGIVANATGLYVNTSYIQSLTANNSTYAFGKSESALNVNNALTANSSAYLDTANLANIQTWITSNSGTAYTNSVSYVDGKSYVNTSQLSSNLANYQTSAGLASNVATLTANNTSFVGTISAANVVSNVQLQANLANYQTSAGLSANVATLTANNATYAFSKSEGNLNVNNALTANSSAYLDTANLANIQTWITSNSGTAYTNAVAYIDGKSYVNTSQLSSNLANYQTSAGLASNVATLTANNTSFVGTISAANVVSNSQLQANLANYQTSAGLASNVATLTANNATYAFGKSEIVLNVNSSLYSNSATYLDTANLANIQTWITSNSGTAYTNSVSYVDGKSFVNTSQLSSNLTNYALLTGAIFSGNVRTQQNAQVDGNLTVSGNLTITGNVTVIGANNLSIVDNMIYLNSNSTVSNPDLGFAGNYNDGVYQHSGFFRDASDGVWKVFDSYLPEPDASPYIDTSNSSFHLANFQANIIYVGNTTVYSTVNTTSFSGTSNNATYAFGKSEGNLNVNNALTANSATYLDTANLANIQTWITSNSGTAYTNAVSYVDGKSYVNTSQLSSNLANYQTSAGLASNVATLTANNATYAFGKSESNLNVNNALTANSATYLDTANLANIQTYITSNATAAYNNAVAYVDGKSFVNTSQLSSNLANYQTSAGLSANVATLTANNSSYLGGNLPAYYTNASNITTGTLPWAQAPAGTVNTSGSFTFSNNIIYNANLTIAATGELIITAGAGIYANGLLGTAGQVLTSNASSVYWNTPTTGTVTSVASGNGLTGDPITTTGTVSILANSGIIANSTGTFVFANTGLVANATGVHVNTSYVATQSGVETLSAKTLKNQSIQYYNSGTTSALDYTNGSHQRWAPTGTVSLTVSNWPASGVLGELLIEGINLGGATITWPTINWIKSDGTTTTTFASNGVTLLTSGTDWVFLWTRDGGTTVYGKIVR